ncbi:SDR family NAD(P)-dependent oxidoreductase [Phytoactinopolyspora halotolerans]|uniref:SDR family oxidoreductase n=1 Tax=Phytoactinopolyspora halotolerans TaxID=1981512 RepID=A0A6L9SA11_9ACTN|nr:3-oxoacyl-ACP reductase FabG [Phytoactinopolyspora halotolerans]NEE01917.1 SDR family oxidoreductase [Phytoactinopolyspora halotolerans]
MQLDLTGRRALVTGGGSGIGLAIARALAAGGADVAVHYASSKDGAETLAKEILDSGRRAVALPGDLTAASDANAVVAGTVDALDGLDILVTNAGHLVGRSTVAQMSDEHWAKVMDVNVTTAFMTTRAAIPHLARSEAGRVVMMSSMAAENGGGNGSAGYAAAKAAVIGLARGLAKELAPDGVTVNAVAPGFIGQTAFHDTFTSPEARAGIVAGIPLGREGVPDDVAGVVAFLASSLSGFVTGQVIDINGGSQFR